jgi:GAF domain-containing protein
MNLSRFTQNTSTIDSLFLLRIRFIRMLAITGVLVAIVGSIVEIINAQGTFPVDILVMAVIFIILSGIAYVLTMYQRLMQALAILIGLYLFVTVSISDEDIIAIVGTIALITGATLGNNYWFLGVNAIVFGKIGYELYRFVETSSLSAALNETHLLIYLILMVMVSGVTRFFITSTESEAQRSARSSYLLRATAEIGEATTKILDQKHLLDFAVSLIQERFAFYHVQVFLIDEDHRFASLIASTGQAGRRLLERGHRLQVGSPSVIGRVTQGGMPVISRDTDADAVHAVNEFLPNTRSELALPILDGERIIGALDVQSTRRNAFDEIDIQALQIVANQLATSIRNARLFEAQKRSVEDNKRLFLEAEAERREIQRLNGQLTKAAWDVYLDEEEVAGSVMITDDSQILEENEWSAYMRQAYKLQRPISRIVNGQRLTAVPIILRNEVLGAIEIASDDLNEAEIVDMVQNVSVRLATTLDNIRLFNEAQIATTQEQRINAIVSNYQTADSIDDLLRITLDELSKTLAADESKIRLGVSKPNTNGNRSGSTEE